MSHESRSTRRVGARPWAILALFAVSGMLAVAGCGGASHHAPAGSSTSERAHTILPGGSTTVVAERPATTAARSAGVGPSPAVPGRKGSVAKRIASKAGSRGSAPRIVEGIPVSRPAPGTGGGTRNDDTPRETKSDRTGSSILMASGPDLCAYVTRAQAARFVGGPVAAPRFAPLGPTCVYPEVRSKTDVTLAVQSAKFDALERRMQHLATFTLAGRRAYCGRFGVTATYVALSSGRVLTITAPCAVGRRFAAAALPHLS